MKVLEDLLNDMEHNLKYIIKRKNLNVHPQMKNKEKVLYHHPAPAQLILH